MASRRMEANMEKADEVTEATVRVDQPPPENVSNEGDPLAQDIESGIMEEGKQGEFGNGAEGTGEPDGQTAAEAGKTRTTLYADNKAAAIKSVDELLPRIQLKVKNFFKGSSSSYFDFSVDSMNDGGYIVKMTKPGIVPESKAIYYKVIDSNGNTIRVYKETYDPLGNLIHVKDK